MSTLNLPHDVTTPSIFSRSVVGKITLDISVYLRGPTIRELDYLVDLYSRICPPDRFVKYKISELECWTLIAKPDLTMSGRDALSKGTNRPFLEPVKNRIRNGRAFEIRFWDGIEIDEPEGSWSFTCRRIHLKSKGLFSFVRLLIPLSEDPEILRSVSISILENVEIYSGHGGLVFVYDPWLKGYAFDHIYIKARRYWGVDVEDLNATLALMSKGIKGINWITLLGNSLSNEDSESDIKKALFEISSIPGVDIEKRKNGSMLTIGVKPVIGDQNHPDVALNPYFSVAKKLKNLYVTTHPDFGGKKFIENGNTLGWIRRFLEPDDWR